ncbi:hypothetical protein BJY01DRAFT_255381 [Aspergillus pseudoustus]|uniref:Uncharacterized protein n=1 Tax=Aspergillus pseudoustus TaxID=1810923 RepID=A0ABR4IKW1_9EURO
MVGKRILAAAFLSASVLASSPLQLVPPAPGFDAQQGTWDAETSCKRIYIEKNLASIKDTDGLTLIPPSGYDFAEVFLEDLSAVAGYHWSLETVPSLPDPTTAEGAIPLGAFTGNTSYVLL